MIHYITAAGVNDAWIANELRVVKRANIPFNLHALRKHSQYFFSSEEIEDFDRHTLVIYPLPLLSTTFSLLSAPLLFRQRFLEALWNCLTGPRESPTIRLKSLYHLLVACHWAKRIRHRPVSLIHSQWIHANGTVGMYGAWLLGVPFSFTGHATDLFRDRAALTDKINRSEFIICISTFHRNFYLRNGARPEQLRIAYCGIDTQHFSPRDNTARNGPVHILSSGRLVEKKGFCDVISACEILASRGIDIRCTIAGSGELLDDLNRQISDSGLQDRVRMTGEPILQENIPEFMHSGDIYCLPCVWASDNDVDGLPQMLMEAMACGLPVISTNLVGIPDLVIDEETGLLIEPNDPQALADAIARLADDPQLASRLAVAGREMVQQKFDLTTCLEPLLDEFRKRLR